VRCAPCMKFYYVEPSLLPMWRRFNDFPWRRKRPPSELLPMTMAEFVARLAEGCPLPHMAYPPEGEEFYYCQARLAGSMLGDIDLYSPPFSCLGRPGAPGEIPSFQYTVYTPLSEVPSSGKLPLSGARHRRRNCFSSHTNFDIQVENRC